MLPGPAYAFRDGSGVGSGSAARGASFGLVTSTVPVSSLDWAACRDAQAGRCWRLAAAWSW